ncbi:MAG: tagatose 6-phosphate kinase [Solirubrobacteraceae bacterium]|nr:tagatose 6-phosphate kinase [Solirubrobacteraceae bacterium]
MILTVTLNFALDVTYTVKRFERGSTARVQTVRRQAGGKGVNVARVLHALGRDVAVTGLVGGFSGRSARAELQAAGLRDELVDIDGESRLTVMVAEPDGQATGFSEPGAVVASAEWAAFRAGFTDLMSGADAVVLAGSLPHSLAPDAYAQLIQAATAAGVPALLDADGEALEQGIAACPAIVSINRAELAGVVGDGDGDAVAGAKALRRAGAGAVVLSQGAAGLTCVTDDAVWHAAPPAALTGNPTGAGDAASAALVMGLLDGIGWPERLAEAAALSAAAVSAPVAGAFDAGLYQRLRTEIVTRKLESG